MMMYDIPGSDCHEWSSVKDAPLRVCVGLVMGKQPGCMAAWQHGREDENAGWDGRGG